MLFAEACGTTSDPTENPAETKQDETVATETETETGKDGTANFKGFYGDYELEINGKKYDISTSAKKDNEFEIFI